MDKKSNNKEKLINIINVIDDKEIIDYILTFVTLILEKWG